MFKKMSFEDYMCEHLSVRIKDKKRIEKDIKLYNGMDVEKEVKWW